MYREIMKTTHFLISQAQKEHGTSIQLVTLSKVLQNTP